uniref:WH2 domain-containing protein n=1 Tax=Macrostomum lignano TaxID=282301 RepID=A0A1I8GZX5_9PLAT
MPPPPPPPPTQPPALTSPEEMPLKKRLRAVHSCEEASSVPAAESNQVQAQSVVLSPTSSANQFLASSSFVDNQTDLQLSTGDKSTVAMDEKTDSSAPIVDDQPADVSAGQQQPPPQPPSPPPPPPMPSLPPPLPPLPPLPALASPGSLPPPSSLLQSPPLPLPTQPPLLPPPPSQPTSLQLTDEAGEGSDDEIIDEEDEYYNVDDRDDNSWSANRPKTPDTEPPDDEDQSAAAAEVEAASASSVNAEDTVREILKRDQEIRDMQELAALERRKTKLMYQLSKDFPVRGYSGIGRDETKARPRMPPQ